MSRFKLKIGDHLATPEKKRLYTEQVFGAIAPRYDFITRALSFWRDSAWKRDLIAALPTGQSLFCVDLACGTGDITLLLAEKYPESLIFGIDIAEPMLTVARRRNRRRDVHFRKEDMGHLGIISGAVDIVTGGYALRNAADLDVALNEIHRILKPRGTAAFLDFSKPGNRFLQLIEYWILKIWAGLWGFLLHRNHEVYSYIAESLRAFPDRTRLHALLQQKGFKIVSSRLYFLGITELIVLRKD